MCVAPEHQDANSDICGRAGVSKGFFHHFSSKKDLGLAAIRQFGSMASAILATAPHTRLDDPRDRVFGYVDFRVAMLSDDIVQFTCLLGTTVQEIHATHPALRAACAEEMGSHIEMLARDLSAAKRLYAPDAHWTPKSVGCFMQSVLQGAFIFAKARQTSGIAAECLAHLRSYLEPLLGNASELATPASSDSNAVHEAHPPAQQDHPKLHPNRAPANRAKCLIASRRRTPKETKQ